MMRVPTKENALDLVVVDMKARAHSSDATLESELSPQQAQRPAQGWRIAQEVEVGGGLQPGKEC